MTTVRIPIARLTQLHAIAISLLALAYAATQWQLLVRGHDTVYGLIEFFDLANEGNLPTFFSTWQLLLCAALIAVIAAVRMRQNDPFRWHWAILSLLAFYLATDEAAQIHELMIRPMRELMPNAATGLLYWAWVMPGLIGVLVVALAYLRFTVRALPADIRRQLITAAALFVGGAIGIEMFQAAHFEKHGQHNIAYATFVLFEETFELVGVLVALNALASHWRRDVGPVALEAGR